jgi:hypothetical protein
MHGSSCFVIIIEDRILSDNKPFYQAKSQCLGIVKTNHTK